MYDRVPVMPTSRGGVPFYSIVMDKIKKFQIQIEEATCDTVTTGQENTKSIKINYCSVICDDERNFGSIDVIDTDQFQKSELVPSQRVDLTTLSHLSAEQRTKLLALLDKYSERFSEKPGFFTVDQYRVCVKVTWVDKVSPDILYVYSVVNNYCDIVN